VLTTFMSISLATTQLKNRPVSPLSSWANFSKKFSFSWAASDFFLALIQT
jgi:hypothetical protein